MSARFGLDTLGLGNALGFKAPGLDVGDLSETPPPPPTSAPTMTDLYRDATPPPTPAPAAPPPRAPGVSMGPVGAPRTIGQQEKAADVQSAAAVDAMTAAKQKELETEAAGTEAATGEYRKQLQADEDARRQAAANVADRRNQLYADADAIANTKIDPNRLYADSSTPQKIAGAISIALGGFLAGAHGQNPGLQMIERQIDQDVKTQMANLENRRASVQQKQSLLGQEIAQGRDEADARHLLTVTMFQNAMKDVDVEVKRAGTATAAAQGAKFKADLAQAAAGKAYEHWKDAEAQQIQRGQLGVAQGHLGLAQQQAALAQQQYAEGAPLRAAQTRSALAQADLHEAQAELARHKGGEVIDPKRTIGNFGKPEIGKDGQPTGRLIYGTIQAPTGQEEQVKEANKKIGELTPVLNTLDDQIRDAQKLGIAEKLGAAVAGEGASDIIQRMNARKVRMMGVAHALAGRVTPTEIEGVEKAAGDPTAFRSQLAKMKEFRELMRADGQAALGTVGIDQYWEPPSGAAPIKTAEGFNAPPLYTKRELQERIMRARGVPPEVFGTGMSTPQTNWLRDQLFPLMKPNGQ